MDGTQLSSPHRTSTTSPSRGRSPRALFAAAFLLLPVALAAVAGPVAAAPAAGWGPAAQIDGTDMQAYNPVVAADGQGNAMAVWHQYDSGVFEFKVSHFTPGVGWGQPSWIAAGQTPTHYEDGLSIGVDAQGNYTVVGSLGGSSYFDMWAIQFSPRWGWSNPVKIDTEDLGDAMSPRLAVAADGTAMAVWTQRDASRANLWASRFIPGSGWTTAAKIETDDSGNVVYFDIAVDASDNVEAVWQQYDGTRYNEWANRYTAGSGWGTAAKIETDDTGNTSYAAVAADPAGGFLAAWSQSDASGAFGVVAARYTDGTGWGAPEQVQFNDSGPSFASDIAFVGAGDARLTYDFFDGAVYHAGVVAWSASSGWGTPGPLSPTPDLVTQDPLLAFGADGRGVAVYRYWDGSRQNMMARTFDPATGWGDEQLLEYDRGSIETAAVAVGPGGAMFAAWGTTGSGPTSVWAAAGHLADTSAPALTVTGPADGTSTDASSVVVQGTTEPGAAVSVDGVAAAVADDGTFSVRIALEPGDNTVVVSATDGWGNTASTTVRVTYNDPAARLAADVADAQANASSAQAALVAMQGQLETVWASLNSTRADLTAATAELTATRASLNDTQSKVDNAPAAGGDSLALVVGLLGAVLGAGGIAMAVMARRGPASRPEEPKPPEGGSS